MFRPTAVKIMARTLLPLAMCGMSVGLARSQSVAQQSAAGEPSRFLVLRGGRLIDGTGRAPIENSLILVEGRKIVRVGRDGEFAIPAGATVVNATGKTIIPGLVDSHVHLCSRPIEYFFRPLSLYWGVTTLGDVGCWWVDPYWLFEEKEGVERGTVVGPSILTVGSALSTPSRPGENSYPRGRNRLVTDISSLEAAILDMKRAGADAIKIYTPFQKDLIMPAVEIAHREGLPAFVHLYKAGNRGWRCLPVLAPCAADVGYGFDELLDAGLDMYAHTFGLEKTTVSQAVREQMAKGEIIRSQHLMNTAAFPALAQQMIDRNIFLNPTLAGEFPKFSRHQKDFERFTTEFFERFTTSDGSVGSKIYIPDNIRRAYLAIFRAFDPKSPALNQLRPAAEGLSKVVPVEHLSQGYRKVGEFVKTFADKGGKVVVGSIDTAYFNPFGMSTHIEMQMLQEVGLTPMQVLQAATLWAMQAWRKDGEVGSVEAGKRADLVVLNRNPLEDIAATRDIYIVIQFGKIIDREALAQWKDPHGGSGAGLPEGRE